MTTSTALRVIIRCPDPFGRRFGKEIGSIEVDAVVTIALTTTNWCAACRTEHRQTLRIG